MIRGGSARDVSSAVTRVESLAESSRKKISFTHFISLPINNDRVQQSFSEFKNAVLDKCSMVGYGYHSHFNAIDIMLLGVAVVLYTGILVWCSIRSVYL